MTLQELQRAVNDGNDFYFMYDEIAAGVESCSLNGSAGYVLWYGDNEWKFRDLGQLLSAPVIHGNAIRDLIVQKKIDIQFT